MALTNRDLINYRICNYHPNDCGTFNNDCSRGYILSSKQLYFMGNGTIAVR